MLERPLPALLALDRGGQVESVHHGAVACVEIDGKGHGIGPADVPVFARSTAKPFQAAAVLLAGAAERFRLDDAEIAIVSASHSGEPEHVALVERLLRKGGFGPDDLRCGTHRPFALSVNEELARRGEPPSPLHHNCSGKHAGMLLLARLLGEDPTRTLDPESEVQRHIRRVVAAALALDPEAIGIAVDGCSAPTFRVPLSRIALGYARLGRPDTVPAPLAGALGRVAAALRRHPRLVGGTGRFDSDLIEGTGGALLAKVGAEGLVAVAWPERGAGLAVKIADGAARGYEHLVPALLDELGALDGEARRRLAHRLDPTLRNHAGLAVGRARPLVSLRRVGRTDAAGDAARAGGAQ